jgi:glycosyl hydrolase family 26
MKIIPKSSNRGALLTLASVLTATVLLGVVPSSGVAGAVGSAGSHTTTTTTTVTRQARAQAISQGPSRGECFTPDNSSGQLGLASVESLVTSFDVLTGTTVNCLSAYLDNTQTWAQWEQPWVIHATVGYSTWVAQDPQVRQLVLALNLIPLSLQDVQNPIGWERACARGNYNSYATKLGQNLVAAGLQNSVIRLGDEMNGEWEPDFIGTKVVEQRLWAKCFDNEVTGLRRAKGEHFLIDWNPNACWAPYPYRNFYPGNAYVNLLGLDVYDIGCMTPDDPLTFTQLANEQFGLAHFEAFAKAKGKAMSLPEWALNKSPSGDDPGFIAGVGKAFDTGNFAFEAYFDEPSAGSLQLSAATPLSVAAFQQWFAST